MFLHVLESAGVCLGAEGPGSHTSFGKTGSFPLPMVFLLTCISSSSWLAQPYSQGDLVPKEWMCKLQGLLKQKLKSHTGLLLPIMFTKAIHRTIPNSSWGSKMYGKSHQQRVCVQGWEAYSWPPEPTIHCVEIVHYVKEKQSFSYGFSFRTIILHNNCSIKDFIWLKWYCWSLLIHSFKESSVPNDYHWRLQSRGASG